MNISQKYIPKWRLDTVLGGTTPQEFSRKWQEDCKNFCERVETSELGSSINSWQDLSQKYRELFTYVTCLFSEDVTNPVAQELSNQMLDLEAQFQKATARLEQKLLKEPNFDKIKEKFAPIAFPLAYRREGIKQKLDVETEALICDLSINGYHSWHELYKQAISDMKVVIQEGPVKGSFALNQLDNLFSNPDREVRKSAFLALEDACKKDESLYAHALRSIIGYRLQVYKKRAWKSPIHESLWLNHLQQSSLDAMWNQIDKAAPKFYDFFKEKAKLLGLEKLSWFDFEAPPPGELPEFPYEDGCKLIVELFGQKNSDLGSFAKRAIESGWIEAENRPKKAPGGFCAPLPQAKESRVFMSYLGSMNNLLVLAHELGHAYHDQVCYELPEMAQYYPSSVAECASTTCELIILDGLIERAKTANEKKRLLFEKIQRHSVFFINIRARFLFEQELFREVEHGFVSPEKLSKMMLEAQKGCYGNSLEIYHPYFWITKIHFYLTDAPSYNFPYTFGYALSLAIKDRVDDVEWYKNFLQDTGRTTCEELVQKHFGKSLQDASFWQIAVDQVTNDIGEFLSL